MNNLKLKNKAFLFVLTILLGTLFSVNVEASQDDSYLIQTESVKEGELEILEERKVETKDVEEVWHVHLSQANILEQPFDESNVAHTLHQNDEVKVTNTLLNGWVAVSFDGVSGYMQSDNLKKGPKPNMKRDVQEKVEQIKDTKDTKNKPKQKNETHSNKTQRNNTQSNNTQSNKTQSKSNLTPNRIYFAGKSVPYANTGQSGCQSHIDANPSHAATFGGATTFSGVDNHNTHFAGHNHRAFSGLWNLGNGSKITVTDSSGNPFDYYVKNKIKVDYSGVGKDGVNYWNDIVGKGSREKITLQTCVKGDPNGLWIIIAE